MERVQKIMTGLGEVEDEIFKRRQQDEERREANYKAKRGRFDNSPRGGYSRYFLFIYLFFYFFFLNFRDILEKSS